MALSIAARVLSVLVHHHHLKFISKISISDLVLTLEGNSETCAHVRSNLRYLFYLRHLIRSSAVKKTLLSISEKKYFPLCLLRCSELSSNICTMIFMSAALPGYQMTSGLIISHVLSWLYQQFITKIQ